MLFRSNTTGTGNVGIGQGVLATNTTGNSNTAVGYQALEYNSTASYNTAVGYQAGYSNSTGTGNTYLGVYAGNLATSNYNTFVGRYAGGTASVSGDSNTCIGNAAGANMTSGTLNTYLGASAGYSMTSGSKNTIIGAYTGNNGGLNITTSSNYIVLSDGDGGIGMAGNTGAMFFGSGNTFATGRQNATSINVEAGSGRIIYNHASTASGSYFADFSYNGSEIGSITQNGTTAVAYNTTSDYRLKENATKITNGVATISQLNPVTFDWISDKSNDAGFLAHEFQAVLPRAVTGTKDQVDAEGKPVYQQMDNSSAVPYLVAAIQELNTLVTTQAATITSLETKLKAAGIAGF